MEHIYLVYEQIIEYFMEKIRNGEFKPGQLILPEENTARLFGVSRGTVRKAFNYMTQMGYIKRSQGKGTIVSEDIFSKISPVKLNVNSTAKTVGVILQKDDAFFMPLIRALDESLLRFGWKMVLLFNDSIEKENYIIRTLIKQKADGIIIIPLRLNNMFSDRNYYLLQNSKIPHVYIGKPPPGFSADAVYLDSCYVLIQIVGELHKRKCVYVAHITNSLADACARDERILGYKIGFERHYEGKTTVLDIRSKNFTDKFNKLLDDYAGKKIGLSLYEDSLLLEFIKIIRARGLRLGTDIEIIGIDADKSLRSHGLSIPSAENPKEQQAKAAVDLLKDKINKPGNSFTHKTFLAEIINGYLNE